ncbi:TIGR03885 family FMN-dependent LLM class oxidoreductase [Dyadobacter sp. CY345]|uniref:TIGR03885 family FMN-dependent LLM class oxidoreductase n=1 Tax=Dyadobacter sp. CY345 TaxID=2909335 RepID=UPI001F43A82C|nr:TIGR03885 family FMN-dependent LLM class oxidoreductase [Dyadobacter sp. CY345]MCF2446685.1 TIGR03885 family FMN-dependent LLM class oxidoreductase [Dyadobacter sp. CY345]
MSKIEIGYHASHEQFKPSELINFTKLAQQEGFTNALSSDHFFPWGETQGESGFAWSWLGAAMQSTNLHFGIVNAPGQRYHPAIIAQAVATLCEMFPHRFWIAVGSGQFLNEHVTAEKWPSKIDRNRRLKECVDVMRALWSGESVTHDGLIQVYDAKLYTLPGYMPAVVGAALTEKTARWVGGWADAMITTSRPPEELKKIIAAFREGGGEDKPVYLKVQLSYDTTCEKALQGAHHQWRNNVFASSLLADIRSPEGFDAAGKVVRPEDMESSVRISDSADQHLEWLSKDIEAGVSQLYLHNVNLSQQNFIEVFGEKVLPYLK